jgi:hypothetical protein
MVHDMIKSLEFENNGNKLNDMKDVMRGHP